MSEHEWTFDRYRNGKLMAEGCRVHASTKEEAIKKAYRLFGNEPCTFLERPKTMSAERKGRMNKSEKQAELDALAHQIALSTVKSDIESFCLPRKWSGKYFGTWYDSTFPSEELEKFFVDNAIRYAELKNLLERNPENRNLVRIKA